MCNKCDKIIEKALDAMDNVRCKPEDYEASLREAISEIQLRLNAFKATQKQDEDDE